MSNEYCASSFCRLRLFSLLERAWLFDFMCREEPEYVLFPEDRLTDLDLDFDLFDFELFRCLRFVERPRCCWCEGPMLPR